jgi:hypothetical protein
VQAHSRMELAGISSVFASSGIDLRSLRNQAAHGRLAAPANGPLVIVTTMSMLLGSAAGELAQFLPEPRLFVADGALAIAADGALAARLRSQNLWMQAQDQLLIIDAPSAVDLSGTFIGENRATTFLDWRPPASLLLQRLTLQVIRYDRSDQERQFMAALPAGLWPYARSSRGALRQRLEQEVAAGSGREVAPEQSDDAPEISEVDVATAEQLLDDLDELPVDPRLRVIADLAAHGPTPIFVPFSRRRSVSYFAEGLAALLGDTNVAVEFEDSGRDAKVVLWGIQRLRGVQVTAARSVWLDAAPRAQLLTLLLTRVLGSEHTVILLAPADALEVEERELSRLTEVIADVPAAIASIASSPSITTGGHTPTRGLLAEWPED